MTRFFFAKNGFFVTALDNRIESVLEIKNLARSNSLYINAIKIDINEIKIDKKFDVVLCNNVFHLLNETEARNLIFKMKSVTRKGGINVVTAFTDEVPPKNHFFLFKKKELKDDYRDWEILLYEEFCSPIRPRLTVKPESVVQMIARKR